MALYAAHIVSQKGEKYCSNNTFGLLFCELCFYRDRSFEKFWHILVHCETAAASILQYLIGKDSKLQKTFFMLKEANITYQLWNPPIPKMWCPSSLVSVICFLTQNHHSITTKNRIGGIRLKYWGQSMMMIWSSKVARSS